MPGPGLESTATALARRGVALERLAMLTLRRDAYASPPGPTLALALGERTSYRAGAWLLDGFDRTALGPAYPPFGGSAGLTLEAGRAIPATLGAAGMAGHTHTLPRDQWAAVTLAALHGTASVGLLLRADATASAYRITATPTTTTCERLEAGGSTTLATTATPWRVGDTLRATVAWDRLRVFRDAILLVDVVDPGAALAGRHAGLLAARASASDGAALAAFVGGELRQEYLGAGLDLGDVEVVLGQPVRFDLTLSNQAPMGGAARFAALLRHGVNGGPGTYDLDRGTARVYTAVRGGLAPLVAATGWIDGPGEITEDRVQLHCRGRDAFLTPRVAPGLVTYVPGPPPGGLTPLPADPCAPSAPPTIIPDPVPGEPVTEGPPEGIGPEAPGVAPDALLGAWLVEFTYSLDFGGGPLGQDIYVGTTSVDRLPLGADPPGSDIDPHPSGGTLTARDQMFLNCARRVGLGSTTFPEVIREQFIYRGPDIGATALQRGMGTWLPTRLGRTLGLHVVCTPATDATIGVALASYAGSGILVEADLAALRPRNPGETQDPFPPRIQTLLSSSVTVPAVVAATCEPDPHVPADAAWLRTTLTPTNDHAIGAVGLGAFTGPQILRAEIASAPVAATVEVALRVDTMDLVVNTATFAGSGPCGAGTHHNVDAGHYDVLGPASIR